MMREIKEYDGKYKINESGIIINKKGHIMKPAQSTRGYLRVTLEIYDDNGYLVQRNNESVHRLVAKTFIPNPDNLPVVMHKDNDKLNNHVSNLKWGTYKENSEQAVQDGLYNRDEINYVHPVKEYEVYNDNSNYHVLCGGYTGVAATIGYAPETINQLVRKNSPITKGNYIGYKIRKTGKNLIKPFKFIN